MSAMKTALNLSQMELVSAIFQEIDRQCPNAKIPPSRVLNTVCRCAKEIVQEAAIEFRGVTAGMGLKAWLESDDTGLSSRFMAYILYGAPACEMNYPRDNDDIGRCERLLIACGQPDADKWEILARIPEWQKAVAILRAK